MLKQPPIYTSAAINVQAHCFACFPSESCERIVAYGSGPAVVLCDCVFNTKCLSLLCDCDKTNASAIVPDVSCVSFVEDGSCLLVGNVAGKVLLITPKQQQNDESLFDIWNNSTKVVILEAKDSIQEISNCVLPSGDIYVSIITTNGETFLVEKRNSSSIWQIVSKFKGPLCECTTINYLCDSQKNCTVLVAVGGVDKRIRLYEKQHSSDSFVPLPSISESKSWVSCLDSIRVGDSISISGGYQDGRIRLWRISLRDSQKPREKDNSTYVENISQFPLHYSITLERVIKGHDDYVTGICFTKNNEFVSCSFDRSIVFWNSEESVFRVWGIAGDVLGGNVLGFRNCKTTFNNTFLCGVGYNGALHLWHLTKDEKSNKIVPNSLPSVTGHSIEIAGMAFLRNPPLPFNFVTVGFDKTVRVHSAVPSEKEIIGENEDNQLFFSPNDQDRKKRLKLEQTMFNLPFRECGRALAHGHAVTALASLGGTQSFVIGSDEGPLRIYLASQSFMDSMIILAKQGQNFKEFCTSRTSDMSDAVKDKLCKLYDSRPFGANLPPLGLSNKPLSFSEANAGRKTTKKDEFKSPNDLSKPMVLVEDGEEETFNMNEEFCAALPEVFHSPPLEERLTQDTLWPEGGKCVGHPTTAQAVAAYTNASYSSIIASTCEVVKVTDSLVRLWTYTDSSVLGVSSALNAPQKLSAFLIPGNETVISVLQFDDSGYYLALGGASLSVLRKTENQIMQDTFEKDCEQWKFACSNLKEHLISISVDSQNELGHIVSLCWMKDTAKTPNVKYIATGHSNGSLCLWKLSSDFSLTLLFSQRFSKVAITALCSSSDLKDSKKKLVFFGTENGEIVCCCFDSSFCFKSSNSQRVHGNRISGLEILSVESTFVLGVSSHDKRAFLFEVALL